MLPKKKFERFYGMKKHTNNGPLFFVKGLIQKAIGKKAVKFIFYLQTETG